MFCTDSRRSIGFSAALVLIVFAFTAPLHAQGIAARAGDALDNAGRNVRNTVESAIGQARAATHEQELLARVYSRIRWDKYLAGSSLEIQTQADGTAILKGSTSDKVRKERAVALTRDTVGITRVIDEISVSATVIVAPPVPPTPATATTVITKPARVIVSTPSTTVITTPPASVETKP